MKAFPEPEYKEPEHKVEFGDYNRRMKAFQEQHPKPEEPKVEFGDYNRRIKGFSTAQNQGNTDRTTKTSYSIQTQYNTFPRASGAASRQQYQEIPSCDLWQVQM